MTQMAGGIAISREQVSDLGRKMLRYRWLCYGVLLLTYIFVYFDRVAPAVVAPELMKEFGLTATSLGILSSMYFYPYAAMQIPSGILSDYLGPRFSVGTFFVIAAIGTALFGLAHSFGTIIFGRFLMGVGVAVVWIPCMRILANWFRPNEFSTLTGVMLTWGNAGAILASAPLAFLVGLVGWRYSFFWLGAFMVILAILNFIILRNKPSDKGFPTVSEIDGVAYYQEAGAGGILQREPQEAFQDEELLADCDLCIHDLRHCYGVSGTLVYSLFTAHIWDPQAASRQYPHVLAHRYGPWMLRHRMGIGQAA